MKMILVQSPCWAVYTPPYSIALLKAACSQHNHQATCLDLNIRFYNYLKQHGEESIYDKPSDWYSDVYIEEIVKKYPNFINECVDSIMEADCRIVGFTTTGISIFFARELASKVKDRDSSKIIIFGGPACFKTEWGPKLLAMSPYIDVVCYLEGEEVLPKLLTMIEQTGKVSAIPGIGFRDKEIVDCSNAELISDLDSLPFADYSDFDLGQYLFKELPIATSRGCVNRCKFCSESKVWEKYRFRSAENVFQEIKLQKERYPFIKSFSFNDSLINGSMRMLDKLCDLFINNKVNISWGGQAMIRREMTKKFIKKMRKAGFSHVSYGLEHASSNVLKAMGKPFTPEVAEKVIRATKAAGIRTDVNIVVGYPGETENDVLATAEFLKRNRKFIGEIYFHPLAILPGAYLHDQREAYGIEFENQYNPNSWYSIKEENNLDIRLRRLEFYRSYLGDKAQSFFALAEYYLFLGDDYFNKNNYDKALLYYTKAKNSNKDKIKKDLIEEKIARVSNE